MRRFVFNGLSSQVQIKFACQNVTLYVDCFAYYMSRLRYVNWFLHLLATQQIFQASMISILTVVQLGILLGQIIDKIFRV
jgi:hypothetical protein